MDEWCCACANERTVLSGVDPDVHGRSLPVHYSNACSQHLQATCSMPSASAHERSTLPNYHGCMINTIRKFRYIYLFITNKIAIQGGSPKRGYDLFDMFDCPHLQNVWTNLHYFWRTKMTIVRLNDLSCKSITLSRIGLNSLLYMVA